MLRRRGERIGAALALLFSLAAVAPDNDIDPFEQREHLEELLPPHMGQQYDAVAFPPRLLDRLASLDRRIAKLDAFELAWLLAEKRDDAHLRAVDPLDHKSGKHARSVLIEIRADDGKPRLRLRSERADPVVQVLLADRDRVEARLDHRPPEKPAPVHFDDARLSASIPCREEKKLRIERSLLLDRGGPPGHAARSALPSTGGNDPASFVSREQNRQARFLPASGRRERDESRRDKTRNVFHDGTIA